MTSKQLAVAVLFLAGFSRLYAQTWQQNIDSAKYYVSQRNKARAISFYQSAATDLQKDSSGTMTFAKLALDLGSLYAGNDELDKAESLLTQSVNISKRIEGASSLFYARACYELGKIKYTRNQFELAEFNYLEALRIRTALLDSKHKDLAAVNNVLGLLYEETGQFDKSEKYYLDARQIIMAIYGTDSHQYGTICNNLANLCVDMGRYDEAERYDLETRRIFEKLHGRKSVYFAINCYDLAYVYISMGLYEKAEPYELEALQIRKELLGEDDNDYAESCNGVGELYLETGRYALAEEYLLKASRIWEKIYGKSHFNYANAIYNLALLNRYRKQFAKSEELFLEAMRIRKELYGTEHRAYAQSCDGIAGLYRDKGDYKNSVKYFMASNRIYKNIFGQAHESYAENCKNTAALFWRMHKVDSASKYFNETFLSQKINLAKAFRFTSEKEKSIYIKRVAESQDIFLSYRSATQQKRLDSLAFNICLYNNCLVLSSLSRLKQNAAEIRDTSLRNKYMGWINVREQLAYWLTKAKDERNGRDLQLEEQANEMERTLSRLSADFVREKENEKDYDWRDVWQELSPGEAAIQFVQFREYNGSRWTDSIYYAALLLRKDRLEPEWIPLFEKRKMEELLKPGKGSGSVQEIRNIYAKGKKPARGRSLYDLVWKPLESGLKNINTIYFSPAGILHKISLAAIPDDQQVLVSDKYKLVQLNSTGYLKGQQSLQLTPGDSLVIFGAIEYTADSGTIASSVNKYFGQNKISRSLPEDLLRENNPGFPYLPGTDSETEMIQELARSRSIPFHITRGLDATEESFKNLTGNNSPAIIHIATHGFFFPDALPKNKNERERGAVVFKQSDNPLIRSGLALAGANNAWKGHPVAGVEDGILTAYEVSNMYLPNTKLAVLSACETGLGDIQGSEGVYGLQRAFKMAGVQNLVMSLWKVPDAETAEFMQEFYKNLFNKESISDAFYHAQTVMKNKYRNDPYKWAAWVLVR